MAYFKLEKNKKGELRAKIQVSGKDSATGKNKIFTKRVVNTGNLSEAKFRKQVEKAAIAFEEEVSRAYREDKTQFRSKVLTFSELMREWKATVKENLSLCYYERIENVEKLFNRYLEQRGLAKEPFCGLDYDEYFETVIGLKPYSPETIKGYRRILRTLFNEAVRYEWIAKNPVCSTKIGAGGGNTSLRPVAEKEVFTLAETKQFLHNLSSLPDEDLHKKTILSFMLLTGVRTAEMCGLKWSDIDFDNKVVHIRRNRLYSKQFGYYEKTPKTKSSVRDIPLTDALINELKKYMDWFRLADEHFDDRLDETYLAVNLYREPVFPQSIKQWLYHYENKWAMKKVTCHGLRHTYCSLLLAQNVPIQTVSKYMGHSDSTVTLKVYSHFIPDTQERALRALDSLIT